MATYKKYSKEFKLQAARLVAKQGNSYQQAAQRLGVTAWSIRNWVQKTERRDHYDGLNL